MSQLPPIRRIESWQRLLDRAYGRLSMAEARSEEERQILDADMAAIQDDLGDFLVAIKLGRTRWKLAVERGMTALAVGEYRTEDERREAKMNYETLRELSRFLDDLRLPEEPTHA